MFSPSMRPWVLSVLLLAPLCTVAQGGKAFVKEAEAALKLNDLERARERYTLAIEVDPRLTKAYLGRAEVARLQGDKAQMASDLHRVAELDPAEPEHAAQAAAAFLEIDSVRSALALCEQALRVNAKHMGALQVQVRAALAANDLDLATSASDKALAVKATTDTYFLHGLVRYATKDLATAEFDLDKVIEWNYLYEPAYVASAEVQLALYERYSGNTMQMRTLEKAIARCTRALELNPQSTDALFVRSKAYALQKEYAKAIDDVSRCIALGREDRAVLEQRARYYHGFGQHQNAVNDLNKALLVGPVDAELHLLRATCREANLDMEGALKDLGTALQLMEQEGAVSSERKREVEESRKRIDARIFEMNREADAPVITILEPFRKEGRAQVSSSLTYVKVSGYVRDKNLLKAITVNGTAADFTSEEKDPQFVVSVELDRDAQEIVVQATDIYDNFSSEVLLVERTEGIAPSIAITLPKPSGDRELTITAGKDDLFVEGRVTDASTIRLIAVNGINASYAPDKLDPDFSIKLNVNGKDQVVVRAEDQFGNASEAAYRLVRSAPVVAQRTSAPAGSSAPNAAGTTWVVHIDNGNYRNFPALQTGPADLARMQKAFANYNVQRTITKKNLTKEQMDRLFNIELRDLARTNKVNTILVWFSGHGRTVGGKAYWIPVDGRKDDIYSYFNYGSLKAQMQNYSESVTNTVVVSDAAGSDASFYELTR